MTTGLLILLNAQLSAFAALVLRDIRAARTHRVKALDLNTAQLQADLATYARAAGKVTLKEAENRGRSVVATNGENRQQREHRSATQVEEFAHPFIVTGGTDGA